MTQINDSIRASFTIWQLPNQTGCQIMSYVIKTINNKIIVIDGGMPGDFNYLKVFIKKLGGAVDVWLITHPHIDHVGAFTEILKNEKNIKIGEIYGSLNSPEWVDEHADGDEKETYEKLMAALDGAGKQITEVVAGQLFNIDFTLIEILGIKNPEIVYNGINNSSIVFRVWDNKKSILFLADLGEEGGRKLLTSEYASRLKCDFVQMAHHGQNGVGKEVYDYIQPKYCLWPTPRWLWENDNGGGKESGAWQTVKVRKWMDGGDKKTHYCMFDGLINIY